MTGRHGQSEAPLVSVVIPTYNRRDLIVETLDSVRAQTYPHWEAIVVDDASTDDTWAYLEQVSREEPRIRPFRREGEAGNVSECRNHGVAHSRGKYVIFLDSDDLLAADCLERRVHDMEAHPELAYIAYLSEIFAETPGDLGTLLNVLTVESDLTRFLRHDNPWHTTGPIWRREVIERYPWDELMLSWEDGNLHMRTLAMGVQGGGVNQPDCYFRYPRAGCGNLTDYFGCYPHVVSHLRGLLSVADLLIERNLMTKGRRIAMIAVAYDQCSRLAAMGRGREARRFWTVVLRKAMRDWEYRVVQWMGLPFWSFRVNGFLTHAFLRMRWKSYWAYPPDAGQGKVLVTDRQVRPRPAPDDQG